MVKRTDERRFLITNLLRGIFFLAKAVEEPVYVALKVDRSSLISSTEHICSEGAKVVVTTLPPEKELVEVFAPNEQDFLIRAETPVNAIEQVLSETNKRSEQNRKRSNVAIGLFICQVVNEEPYYVLLEQNQKDVPST